MAPSNPSHSIIQDIFWKYILFEMRFITTQNYCSLLALWKPVKKAPQAKLTYFRLPAKTACSMALSQGNTEKPGLYCQDVARAIFLVKGLGASGPVLIMQHGTNPLRLKIRGAFLFWGSILLKLSLMRKKIREKPLCFCNQKSFQVQLSKCLSWKYTELLPVLKGKENDLVNCF